MPLLESGQDYLESILKLSRTSNEIHAIDIVNDLGFSKPSVSIALKKLKQEGYVTIDANSHIHLTEIGLKEAEKIFERHNILTSLLIRLGVDESIAEADACKIEHDLSEESFNAIKKMYNKFKEQ